jgi:hypothetical protein
MVAAIFCGHPYNLEDKMTPSDERLLALVEYRTESGSDRIPALNAQ